MTFSMRLPERQQLRFSSTESFMLFMEGLRALQLFQDTREVADLDAAATWFTRCVERFPDDELPGFYLASTWYLQSEVNPDEDAAASARTKAKEKFQKIQNDGPESLRASAEIGAAAADLAATPPELVKPATESRTTSLRSQVLEWWRSPSPRTPDEQAADLQLQVIYLNREFSQKELNRERIEARLAKIDSALKASRVPMAAQRDLEADLLNARARYSALKGDHAAAEQEARKALAINPDWIPAQSVLVRALNAQEKTAEASAAQEDLQRLRSPL
jgi:hypothetical protein